MEDVIILGASIPADYRAFADRTGRTAHLVRDPVDTFPDQFDDVISLDELYQVDLEKFRRVRGLSHRSVEAVTCLTDKSLFKKLRALKECSVPYIEFSLTVPLDKIASLAEQELGFPCVVKPSNGLYSAGVVRANSAMELQEAYYKTRAVTLSMKKRRNTGSIILERYVDGQEYMIDGFCIDGSYHFILKHLKKPDLLGPHFHETGCITRRLQENECERERDIIRSIFAEVGLKNSPFHAEFRMDRNGRVVMLELAPRLGGGGTSTATLMDICAGISAYSVLHSIYDPEIATGMLVPRRDGVGLEFDFFAKRAGRLESYGAAIDYCHKMGANKVFAYKEEGSYVHPPPENVDTILTAFFECASLEMANELLTELSAAEVIVTRA